MNIVRDKLHSLGRTSRSSFRSGRSYTFMLYSASALLMLIVVCAYQGPLFSHVHRYFEVGASHPEEIFAQQFHKVDERIVKMCKKELLAAKDVHLLGTRCRKTLLKYLAQQKQEEKRRESETDTS